jgi:hypothetical protein
MEVISDKQIASADGIIAVGLGFDGQFASRREGFAQVSIDSEFDFCVTSRTIWLQKFAGPEVESSQLMDQVTTCTLRDSMGRLNDINNRPNKQTAA